MDQINAQPGTAEKRQNSSGNILRAPEEMSEQERAQEIGWRVADIMAMRQRFARGEVNLNIRRGAA